jgi:hypothetical protein
MYVDQRNKLWSNPGWVPLGYPNDLTRINLSPDFKTHVWSLEVRNNTLNFTEDEDTSIGPFSLTDKGARTYYTKLLPSSCTDTGVFLRVFNATAIFSDFSATELAS